MTPIGLIANPLSGRNRASLAALETLVHEAGAALHYERLERMDDLTAILARCDRRGVRTLALAGGDGTVQAVLTALYERQAMATPPRLALLPCGTTNMTANDIGLPGRARAGLERLLRLARDGTLERHLVRRPVMRVENGLAGPPQRGMFFGTAGIMQAIQFCRTRAHALGLRSHWAIAATLAGMLGRHLLTGNRLPSSPITFSLEGGAPETMPCFLLLATTLERLVLRSRPFWNQGGGPIHFTALRNPPRRLWLAWPRILYGGNERSLDEASYRSRSATTILLDQDGAFTLDGQIFEARRGKPLRLSAPDEAAFILPGRSR